MKKWFDNPTVVAMTVMVGVLLFLAGGWCIYAEAKARERHAEAREIIRKRNHLWKQNQDATDLILNGDGPIAPDR